MTEKNSEKILGGDVFTPELVEGVHNDVIESIGLPSWLKEVSCLRCGEPLKLVSFRGIGLKLNASRIGDLVVEIACDKCSSMYDIYYRKACNKINDFIEILKSPTAPSEPILLNQLRNDENNLLEKLVESLVQKGKEQENGEI